MPTLTKKIYKAELPDTSERIVLVDPVIKFNKSKKQLGLKRLPTASENQIKSLITNWSILIVGITLFIIMVKYILMYYMNLFVTEKQLTVVFSILLIFIFILRYKPSHLKSK